MTNIPAAKEVEFLNKNQDLARSIVNYGEAICSAIEKGRSFEEINRYLTQIANIVELIRTNNLQQERNNNE